MLSQQQDPTNGKKIIMNHIETLKKNHLYYRVENGHTKRFKPWLGDSIAFLYDFIMKYSIFPKKLGADMVRHHQILHRELRDIHGKRVLELATGSGSAAHFLPNDNRYTGTDISPGLLRKSVKRFRSAGFKEADFYVTSADDLPFEDNRFSVCLCNLSLNFFDDVKNVFQEAKRVLIPGSVFIGSVPVPERKRSQTTIRGTLYSETALESICRAQGFIFKSIPFENGALLYFKAVLV